MNGDCSERLSQENERYQDSEGCILESASAFACGVLKEIEELAGTTSCKSLLTVGMIFLMPLMVMYSLTMRDISILLIPSYTNRVQAV